MIGAPVAVAVAGEREAGFADGRRAGTTFTMPPRMRRLAVSRSGVRLGPRECLQERNPS